MGRTRLVVPISMIVALLSPGLAPSVLAAPGPKARVDFARHVLPLFERACVACHGPKKASAGLQLGSAARIAKGGISEQLLVPGQARASYLVKRLRGEGDEARMPLGKKPLSPRELALIERWIDQGAELPAEPPPRFAPAPGGLRRLTVAQYHNTLRHLFGQDAPLPRDLEPDTLVAGSATVGAARVALSPTGVEKFAVAASELARRALADPAFRARLLPCAQGPEARLPPFDAGCAAEFIAGFGRRAWRRPLTPDERTRYLGLAADVARSTGDFRASAAVVLAAFLQSPNFLYRTEVGAPDPTDPTRHRLGDFELASRLSYFLWGAPPDDELLEAAEAGRLQTEEGLGAEARRMLKNPLARQTMAEFFVELFRLRRLDRISESRTKYRQYSPTLGQSLRGETLRVIEEVAFSSGRDFREIFTTGVTHLNPELARLYGIELPAGTPHDAWVRTRLPVQSERRGVLALGAFLTIFAHPTSSSPTKRGKFIRESLLCQAVPPPPPDVQTKLPADEPGAAARTTRQKLEAHRKDSRCNGCHKFMDPLGLAFEPFDGIGAFRREEQGLPIDPGGDLDGVAFSGPAGLGALLAKSPAIGACVARSLYRFATGHLETEGEEPLLAELARGLERDGYRFEALVTAVITSEAFRVVAAPVRAGIAANPRKP